ncbi:sulfatase [Winogradskyella sp.]|nr:sulfatase [Winogradskyella sp.]MDB4752536.1 sulfatase [Winogradskyella sp.]
MNKWFLCALLLIFAFAGSTQNQQPLKNVLFVMVDDLRPELKVYGQSHIKSPNIDALASEGITFNRAYCNVPVCGASRASLLSGMRPTAKRFLKYNASINEAGSNIHNIVEYFNSRGYKTISNNKITHLKNDIKDWDEEWYPKDVTWRNYQDPQNRALDKNKKPAAAYERLDIDDSAYFDAQTADKTIEDLKKLKSENSNFFLAVGFVKPHLPFTAPEKYWDLYDIDSIQLPKQSTFPATAPAIAKHSWGELRHYKDIPNKGPIPEQLSKTLIHAYFASVSFVDAQIGRIIKTLDDLELRDNTIVVLVGDHGWSLSEHGLWAKHSNFEVALQVPLIISAPEFPENKKTNSIAELVDLYPTLCDLTKGEKPLYLQGNSLVSSLQNPDKIYKTTALARWQKGETLIEDNYFYTEWTLKSNRMQRMLYDHSIDPDETVNLVELKRYNILVDSMSRKLKLFKKSFN